MSSSSSSTHLVTLVRADIATEMQPIRGQCAGHVICADQSEPDVGERRGSISGDHWEKVPGAVGGCQWPACVGPPPLLTSNYGQWLGQRWQQQPSAHQWP